MSTFKRWFIVLGLLSTIAPVAHAIDQGYTHFKSSITVDGLTQGTTIYATKSIKLPDGTVFTSTNQFSGGLTLGTTNGLSLSGTILSLGLSSGNANGALKSSDWTTFNNKLSTTSATSTYLTQSSATATYFQPANATTNNLPEGANLYFTTARATSAISATEPITYSNGVVGIDKSSATLLGPAPTTSSIPEGTNQYFTTARATSAISATSPVTYANGVVGIDASSVTLQGNTFNTGSNLVQLVAGSIPSTLINGSSVTKQGTFQAGTNITLTPGIGFTTIDSTADLSGLLSNSSATVTYLQKTDAANTYLTQTNASNTYLTQSSATATYIQTNSSGAFLTTSSAAATYQPIGSYLTTSSAASTYFPLISSTTLLTTSSATATYLPQTTAASTYLTQSSASATYFQIASTPTFMSQSSFTANGLTLSSAAGTYFQIASTVNFVSQSSATANFLSQSSATATYMTQSSSTANDLKLSSAVATYVPIAGASTITGQKTFSSVIQGPDGSVGAPSYSFTNSTTTGMYLGSTNRINFTAGGADRLRIDNGFMSVIGVDLYIPTTKKLYLDGGDDSYLSESSANQIDIYTGGGRRASFLTTGSEIFGTTTNNNATTGYVGEYIESVVSVSSNFPTANTYGDLTSIALTAGDWEVTVNSFETINGSTILSMNIGASTAAGNDSTGLVIGDNLSICLPPTVNGDSSCVVPSRRFSLSGSATVYLKYRSNYSVAPPQARGRISARRMR